MIYEHFRQKAIDGEEFDHHRIDQMTGSFIHYINEESPFSKDNRGAEVVKDTSKHVYSHHVAETPMRLMQGDDPVRAISYHFGAAAREAYEELRPEPGKSAFLVEDVFLGAVKYGVSEAYGEAGVDAFMRCEDFGDLEFNTDSAIFEEEPEKHGDVAEALDYVQLGWETADEILCE